METPLLSIIITCFNNAQFLERAVQSAVKQSCRDREIILIDDGSDSETKEVISKLKPYLDIVIQQENLGPSAARNSGINSSSGKYIFILDGDDFIDETLCQKALSCFRKDEEARIVSCFAQRFNESNIIDVFETRGGVLTDFLLENRALGTSFFRKNDAVNVGLYDEKMKSGFEDWEFFIRLLKNGGRAVVLTEPLYHYRKRSGSRTTFANKKKYELQKYIYLKHQDLYKENFEIFIEHSLNRLQREEREKIKNTRRIEYRIGKAVLAPIRIIKKGLRSHLTR